MGSDKDRAKDTFLPQKCQVHHGHPVGGNPPPHPRFPRRDMLVPWKALNDCHTTTTQCAKGAERKRHRMAEEKMRESMAWAF